MHEFRRMKFFFLTFWNKQATRGSLAAKIGVPKVSRQVALAYARRTLARCRKFEESGTSCFSEPSFRDIIFAPPHRMVEAELLTGILVLQLIKMNAFNQAKTLSIWFFNVRKMLI